MPDKKNFRTRNFWKIVQEIIEKSDIVLEVLDARMPELSRNFEVEKLVNDSGKKLILVLNKADLVSKPTLERVGKALRDKGFLAVFVDSSYKAPPPKKLIGMVFGALRDIPKPVRFDGKVGKWSVGVIGYPNTGKSSLINLITRRKKVIVSRKAGTTRGVQWVSFGDNIRILDSPGVIPLTADDPVRFGLLGVRNPEKMRNLEFTAEAIVDIFLHQNRPALERVFGITIPNDGLISPDSVVALIAFSKGFVKKGGLPDEYRTHLVIVRAWNDGTLRL